MKKLLVIILLMVYGLSSSGMTVQFHYCCGKLKKIEFRPIEQTACKHGMQKMKSRKCCENKSVELKVKTDQKAEHTTAIKSFKQAAEARMIIPAWDIKVRATTHESPVTFARPPDLPTSLFIMHCVYRI